MRSSAAQSGRLQSATPRGAGREPPDAVGDEVERELAVRDSRRASNAARTSSAVAPSAQSKYSM